MAILRKDPFIHVSWLREHLIGEHLCKWSVWHKIFYDFEKAPSDFDSVKWKMDHTALLNEVIKRYASAGYELKPEFKIRVPGAIAALIGKIDLLALNETNPLVIEVKTGKPRESDKMQLLLYLWALGRSDRRYYGVPFDGLLIYENREIEVSALEIDEKFITNFKKFMKEILDGEPDRKYPNKYECRNCKIGDCDERIDKDDIEESDFISDYF